MLGEVLTAIVTPFRADGSVDLDRFRELAEFLVENGSDGIVVCGTTGESPTLARRGEVRALGDRGRRARRPRDGRRRDRHVRHRALDPPHGARDRDRRRRAARRDAVLQQAAAARRSSRTSRRSPPRATGRSSPTTSRRRVVVNIEPETIERLAQIPTVCAVKQAHDDLEQARQIPGFGLDLYAGDDNLTLPFLELGGVGVISRHAHVVGPQMKEMVARLPQRRLARARRRSTSSSRRHSSS